MAEAAPLTGRLANAGALRRPRLAFLPDLPRPVWLLQAGGLANALGSGLVLPFVLVYLHDARGIGVATAGLVAGTFGFVGIGATPLAGALADRLDARRVLAASLLVLAAAYGLFPFVHAAWQGFLVMALAGAGNGGFWPSQSVLTMSLTPREQRHHASAVSRTAYNVGLGAGSALGGLLLATGAGGYPLLFALDAATFAAFAALLGLVPAPERATPAATAPSRGYRDVARDRVFLALMALTVVWVAAGYAPLESLLPLYAEHRLGVAPAMIGVVFLGNMLAVGLLQLPAARLLEGRRRLPALAAMAVVWSLALLAVPAAGLLPLGAVVPALVAAAVAFGAAECVLGPAQGPLVVDLAPPELRGRYLATLTNAYAVGFAVGPALGGAALAVSPHALWPGAAAALAASALAALALERRLPESLRRVPS